MPKSKPDSTAKLYVTLTPDKEGIGEYEDRRSVFIGHAVHIKTEAAARDFIDEIRKRYSDARHNCYAYRIGEYEAMRYSDDGEPQGTAGLPILNVIRTAGNEGITDACIVVTRYFGGVLLGTGGLTRAYGEAAKLAVLNTGITEFEEYAELDIICGYADYERLLSIIPVYAVKTDDTDYSDIIAIKAAVPLRTYADFIEHMAEISGGKIKAERRGIRFDA